MKKSILIVILTLFLFETNAQVGNKYISRETDFKPDEIAYLFGNDVKLRSNSSTDSDVIELLKITSEIKIIEKTATTYFYNGIDWPWYKVKYRDNIGYIIGGLISLDKRSIDNTTYLITLKKVGGSYKILTRAVNENTNYLENMEAFETESYFTLEVLDSKGVDGIKNMLLIDYQAEACGIDGGGYYLFNDGKSLKKAIAFSSVADGGMYWVHEKVIFPNDVEGKKGKIIFSSEQGAVVNESNNRTKIVIETIEFVWEGKLLALKNIEE